MSPDRERGDAQNSLRLIDDADDGPLPFSPKKGTPAARMPQVDSQTVRRGPAGCARRRRGARRPGSDLVGSRQRVLVESGSGGGHAENFAPVRVAGAPIGEIVNVRIEAVDQDMLIGVAE